MSDTFNHTTVLLNEAVDTLEIIPDGVYVDCTLGGAGHSELLLSQLSEKGHLYAFDQDAAAIAHAKEKLKPYIEKKMVTFIHQNFSHLKEALEEHGVAEVNGILYDLGVSSPQLDQAERGFSYHQDAPLDMRMDQTNPLTAKKVVNEYDYRDLVRIFFQYGEEKFSKQVARKIEKHRQEKPIETTGELVEIIKEAIPAPARRKGGHPAKRIFQAIRMEVNDELAAIEDSLKQAIDLLAPFGYLSVITFHSLEDKLVKKLFREYSKMKDTPPGLPVIPKEFEPILTIITKKPILPSKIEIEENNRSRSAKLRVVQKNIP